MTYVVGLVFIIQHKKEKKKTRWKRGIFFSKKKIGLPALLVWVPLLIVNNYSEFQENIFCNNRDIRKCQSFRMTMTPGL